MIHEAPLICFYVFGTNITVQLCVVSFANLKLIYYVIQFLNI